MADIFERLIKNYGPIGQHRAKAHGYFAFPKLEGEISSRMKFRGGATILFDLNTQSAVYMIRKRFDQVARVTRSQAAWQAQMDAGNNYTGLAAQAREPFAFLHRR